MRECFRRHWTRDRCPFDEVYIADAIRNCNLPIARDFLRRTGSGFGLWRWRRCWARHAAPIACGEARAGQQRRSVNPLAPRPAHFPAKAKTVIWLFMNGGPSQVDTWDYKPELEKRDGQELKGFDKNTGFFTEQVGPLMKSPFKFAAARPVRGLGLGDLSRTWPSTSTTWPSSTRCFTETNNHSPALFQINTGMSRMGFPVRRRVGDLRPGHARARTCRRSS